VPVEVIGNLLAVPREERGPLREWSLAILGRSNRADPGAAAAGEQAVRDFLAILKVSLRAPRQLGDPSVTC
jgi:hypothetical protein